MWAILHLVFNFNPLTTCMVVKNPNHLGFGLMLMWGSQENIGMFIWNNMINFFMKNAQVLVWCNNMRFAIVQ
jgi:hypothetical protein